MGLEFDLGELYAIDERVEVRYYGRWLPARVVDRDATGWPSYTVLVDDLDVPIRVNHDSCTLRRVPSDLRG
jgi:hypothetical protein